MSGLVDRIAAVLREHRWLEEEWACHCGNRHLRLADHPAHVAEQIAAELQLTEETQEDWNGLEWPPVRRWVSAWSAVEGKP